MTPVRDSAAPGVPPRRRAAAVAALLGTLALTAWGGTEVVAAAHDTDTACHNPATVQVAAPAEIADSVQHAAQEVEDSGTVCADYVVTPQAPGDTYQSVVSSAADQPQVWISDSPAWTELIGKKLGDGWVTVGDTIATSPVVLGVPKAQESKKKAAAQADWAQLLGNEHPVGLVDTDESSASLMQVVAADQQARSKDDQDSLMRNILRVSRSVTTSDGMLQNAVKNSGQAQMFPLTEQQYVTFNRAHPGQRMSYVVPRGGAEELQYQWVTPVRATQAPQAALTALRTQLMTPAEVQYRASQGFRDAAGGSLGTRDGLPAKLPQMPQATPQQTIGANTAWENLKKDARMLVLVDVSGSMLTPTGPGQTRVGLLEQTAIGALNVLPQTTRMGAWAFSSDLQKNHVDYLPLSKGEQPLLDTQYKDGIIKQAHGLPALAKRGGDTALYDSIAAAFKSVNDSYDPNYINSVVVLTDGTDDDPNGGLSLQQLLAQLKSQYDVDKPVKIVTIAIGTDTDPQALEQIAKATDGLSYRTTSPDQIASVFVNAFLHRTDY